MYGQITRDWNEIMHETISRSRSATLVRTARMDHAKPRIKSNNVLRTWPPFRNNAGQTNSFTPNRKSLQIRPHSIASSSWMESVPYWLKQHERHELLEHVYTNLHIFSLFFFFIYSPFIKASTLDNNIVSLLDFWLFFFFFFFWTPSYPSRTHSLPLNRSRSHTHSRMMHSFFFSFSFSLSLSFSLEKYFVVHDRPVLFFHALLNSNVRYNSTVLISRVSPN